MKSFKQEFIEQLKMYKRGSCCSYAFVKGDGTRVFKINDICFASLRSASGIKSIRFFINKYPEEKKNERIKKHVDFIVQELYPEMFLNKKCDYYKEGLLINTKRSINAIFYVMTLIRMSWEKYEYYIPNVDLLESLGFDTFHAMIVAQYFQKVDDNYRVYNYYGHHGVTSEHLSIKAINKISLDVFKKEEAIKNKANGFSIFIMFEKLDKGETLQNFLCSYIEPKGDGWQRVNYIANINKALIDLKEKLYA